MRIGKALLLHTSRQEGPRIIRITSTDIYEANVHIPLIRQTVSSGQHFIKLIDVSINRRNYPKLLVFVRQQYGGIANGTNEVRIPIPEGFEVEAKIVVQRFKAQFPEPY